MANKEPKKWITVRGRHIPLYDGETAADAVKRLKSGSKKGSEVKKATVHKKVDKEQKDKLNANEKKYFIKGKRVTKEEFDKAVQKNKEDAKDFVHSDKAQKAMEYAKGKIDREVYSWPETVADMRYEQGLSYKETKELEDILKVYAMKQGKFQKYHEDWKKDFKNRDINVDTLISGKKELKQVHKPEDLMAGKHYTDNVDYKVRQDWLRENSKKYTENKEEWLSLREQIDKERYKHVDKGLVESLGRDTALFLVNDKDYPEILELKQKADTLKKSMDRFEKSREEYYDYFDKIDKVHSRSQREEYGRPDFEKATGEYIGFETKKSTVPYYDDLVKKGKAEVVEMTPEQYIHECAHYIFTDSTWEKTLRGRIEDKDTLKYAQMMREGVKFYTPYLNYADEAQEGLHRAVAAYINGIKKIPVIIVGTRR